MRLKCLPGLFQAHVQIHGSKSVLNMIVDCHSKCSKTSALSVPDIYQIPNLGTLKHLEGPTCR